MITIITMVVYLTFETLNDGRNSGMTGIYTVLLLFDLFSVLAQKKGEKEIF
ncbi:hypothetical protein GLYMA_02G200100v4 [Glycine max]|uniref:Uncharacterized protein n=1 Tax=Glycine max TaxID=3847 RepID=K7K9P2_SOYBN|nr:hypothetical protein JHK85_005022 [Glycine max]KAH1061218.1 hypothetical protein GYH30_004628 [Glycine max]KRH72238.1 hypothetical protein GLYMA_02G200100v4 [Glycine max]